MAKLTIDGKELEVPDGTRLFDACTGVRGEPLPHFCYHPDLSVAGVCRLCQVEIEGMPKLAIACNTTVQDGMVVQTRSEKVRQAARQILEMHLINHPVDCPICDQAGECGLQNQYMEYGLYSSEVAVADKAHKRKAKVIGPHVILDQERCVLCSRCVRFCEEVTGTRELGIFNRGDRAELDVAPGKELANNYSLNTVDICPVGALTSRDFRFQQRVWLLSSTPSVCPGCATGCNVRLDHAADRIYRLKPRYNPEVNGRWMCDRGRLCYKAVHDEKRLGQPLLRQEGELRPAAWPEIWPVLRDLLKPGSLLLALANAHQSLEELALFKRLVLALAGEQALVGALAGVDAGEGDELLLAADRAPNRRALAWLGLPELSGAEAGQRLAGANGSVLIYGQDPAGGDAALGSALASCDRVIYLGTHQNTTARAASVVLPVCTWAEKDGLFVNRNGRVQGFSRAVAGPTGTRQDWQLLTELMSELTGEAVAPDLAGWRRQVASELGWVAGEDLDRLPATGLVPANATGAPAGGAS